MHRLITSRRELLLALAALGVGLAVPAATAASAATAGKAPRLVCVGGALTEIVYALGAERQLVGVDTTSLYPPAARALASVGYERTLSAEGLLSLAPTAVIASEDAGPPTVLRQLAAAGVPVHVLAANHRFEGVLTRIERVGQLTGHSAQADQQIAQLKNDWRATRMRVAQSGAGARVLFIMGTAPGQWMVAGQGTAADAMLRYAGASNALQGFNGYRALSAEGVVAARPDAILLTDQGLIAAGGVDGVLRLSGIDQTPAGRARRIVTQDALLLLGFGPRLPQAVDQLAAALQMGRRP